MYEGQNPTFFEMFSDLDVTTVNGHGNLLDLHHMS